VTCDACGGDIPDGQAVGLNGRNFHVERCFAEGLRRYTFKPAELAIELAPTMPPMVAYKAGQTYVATIVAARRKAKAK